MTENFIWWNPPKKTSDEEKRRVTLERAKQLFNALGDFRSDAWRYFKIVDFKVYNPESEDTLTKDSAEENILLHNPILTLNAINSCIETASNKIAKIKPRVTFLTKNADREHRETARKLDNWTLKFFKKGKAWKQSSQAFKSACVCGLGIVKIMPDEKVKISFKKIPVFNFFCNNTHKGNTLPEEAGEVKNFTLNDLLFMFPSKEKELKEQHGEQPDKRIKTWEIYRQYKQHMILTENVTLLDEKWEKPLPYQLFKWEEADQGVVGVGIAKKLYEIQSAISYILGKTFKSIRNFAIPRAFVQKGSEPNQTDITNLVGEIIEVNPMEGGKLPEFSTPPAINNQVLDILLMLWQKAFEIVGISQLSAGGQIPRGLEKASGTALRAYQQTESERFQLIRSDYEQAFVSMAKKAIAICGDNLLPKGLTRKEIMERKDELTVWTSSLLPESPAGKLAMVSDLQNSGFLNKDQALALLDSPDTSKYLSSETSRLRAIDLILDRALEKGKKPIYYSELGLDLFLDRSRKMLAEILIEDEESEKIPLLQSCIEELNQKVSEQTKIGDTINAISGEGGPQGQQKPEPLNAGATSQAY